MIAARHARGFIEAIKPNRRAMKISTHGKVEWTWEDLAVHTGRMLGDVSQLVEEQ